MEAPPSGRGRRRGSNALLLCAAGGEGGERTCHDLLAASDPAESDLLCVAAAETPDELVESFRRRFGGRSPARIGVVSIGEIARSAAADAASTDPAADRVSVETVSNPADLTGVGMRLSTYLSAWADDGNRPVVCFRALPALIEATSTERVFRFLHVSLARLKRSDAHAHFHLDPEAHDDRTVNTITGLFDAVIEVDDDGEAVVRTS